MTGNWKDGMADNTTTSIENQILALGLIAAQIGFSGYLAATENFTAVVALSIVYSGSSLLGYFNVSNTPVLSCSRLNINSVILTAFLVVSMMQNGFSLTQMLLAGTLTFDLASSFTNRSSQVPGDLENISPIFGFFLESWRNNAFTDANIRSNFNQVFFQVSLIFAQLFFLIISLAENQISLDLGLAFMTFNLASLYSFFNPSRVTAINALQSNAA
jgi:hypothetical protein